MEENSLDQVLLLSNLEDEDTVAGSEKLTNGVSLAQSSELPNSRVVSDGHTNTESPTVQQSIDQSESPAGDKEMSMESASVEEKQDATDPSSEVDRNDLNEKDSQNEPRIANIEGEVQKEMPSYSSDESDVGESELLSAPLDDTEDEASDDTASALEPTIGSAVSCSMATTASISGSPTSTSPHTVFPLTFSLEPDDDLLPDTAISNLADSISEPMRSEPAISNVTVSCTNLSSIAAKPPTLLVSSKQFQTTNVINLTQDYSKVPRTTIMKRATHSPVSEVHKPTQVIFIGPPQHEASEPIMTTASPQSHATQPSTVIAALAPVTYQGLEPPVDVPPMQPLLGRSIGDPDESNVITIAPKDIDSDDDECCIVDPDIARRIPPPTSGNNDTYGSQTLCIQSVQSLHPTLKSQLPSSSHVPVSASTEQWKPSTLGGNQPVVNVELKNQNTIFGLMMIIRDETGTTREFFCNFCLTKSTEEKVFMDHVASHLFVCGLCPYQSFARVDVVRHILKIHPDSQNNLAKLHTMHMENVTLKPQDQSMALSSGSSNAKSWSNVLGGNTIVQGAKHTVSVSIPSMLKKTTPGLSSKFVSKTAVSVTKTVNSITNSVTIAPRITPQVAAVTMTNQLTSLSNTHVAAPPVMSKTMSSNALPTVVAALPNSAPNPGQNILVRPAIIQAPRAAVNVEFLSAVPPNPAPKLAIPSYPNAVRRTGITVLEKSAQPAEDIYFVSFPTTQQTAGNSIVVNGKSHRVVMYQCGKCKFRDQDHQVVRMHQKAHMFSKLTIILSAYGVVCPHCLSVHRTIPYIYEHLDLMHKKKPPAFFVMIRCMGANDMYWFCPCCNVVKSEKQKQVVWQHVLTGHDNDNKFLPLKHKMLSKGSEYQYAEKFLVDLWVNGFVLNTVTTCTAVVPKIDSVPFIPADGTAKDAEKGTNVETTQTAPVIAPTNSKEAVVTSAPASANSESACTKRDELCPAKLLPSDIENGKPSKHWLEKHCASCKLGQSWSKRYGKVITIECGGVPEKCMHFNYKHYYHITGADIPECKVCGKLFPPFGEGRLRPLIDNIEEHIFKHFNIRCWVCPYCVKQYKHRSMVVAHVHATHGNLPCILIHMKPSVDMSERSLMPRTAISDEIGSPIENKLGPLLSVHQQEYVYTCFHCIRQVASIRQMWSHMRFVHPEKPFSRSMFQRFHMFDPDYGEEIWKIKTGERKAEVCVVRVEHMAEYEGLRALLSLPLSSHEATEDDSGEKPVKAHIIRKLPPSKDNGKYECGTCGYRSNKLETTRSHMLQEHPGEELSVRDHAAVISFDSRRTKGRMLYLCPSCTFFSNKREALLVHAGRNPSHFSNIQSGLDLEEAKQLVEKQTGHNLRERTIKPVLEEELVLPVGRGSKCKPLKRPAAIREKTSPYLMRTPPSIGQITNGPPLKKRFTARKSTTKPTFGMQKTVHTMTNMNCALCVGCYESNLTCIKYHFSKTHPEDAVVAINNLDNKFYFICPDPYCNFFDEFPALIRSHLLLYHDGDPKNLRLLYSDAALSTQQITKVTSSKSANDETEKHDTSDIGDNKNIDTTEVVVPESTYRSVTMSLSDPDNLVESGKDIAKAESSRDKEDVETSLIEDGMDSDGMDLSRSSFSSNDNFSDDKERDPDYHMDEEESSPKVVRKKRKKNRARSGLPRFSCLVCSWGTNNKWAARAHVMNDHASEVQRIKDNTMERNSQPCILYFCREKKCLFKSYHDARYATHVCFRYYKKGT